MLVLGVTIKPWLLYHRVQLILAPQCESMYHTCLKGSTTNWPEMVAVYWTLCSVFTASFRTVKINFFLSTDQSHQDSATYMVERDSEKE
jgi:hypothetical protein